MGEAKRRKQLGLPPKTCKYKIPAILAKESKNSRFSIAVSQLTGNWLIVIDGCFCYDSAMRLPDAEKVLDQLIEYEKNNPLPPLYRSTSQQEYTRWTLKSAPFIQDVPAIGSVVESKDFFEAKKQGFF